MTNATVSSNTARAATARNEISGEIYTSIGAAGNGYGGAALRRWWDGHTEQR